MIAVVQMIDELIIGKGDDREEYAISAARERDRKLKDFFGEELWNVALEPERRNVCKEYRRQ